MTDTDQRGVPVEVSYARVFYKHLLRTVALALAAFSIAGGTAVQLLYSSDAAGHPAFAVVGFLSWGMIAAAVVVALRKPPF